MLYIIFYKLCKYIIFKIGKRITRYSMGNKYMYDIFIPVEYEYGCRKQVRVKYYFTHILHVVIPST